MMDEKHISYTLGKLCACGAGIDVLSGGNVVLQQGQTEVIAAEVEHEGQCYRGTTLHPNLSAELYLPSSTSDYGTLESLVKEVSEVFRINAAIESEETSVLLAAAVLASWIPEALPAGAVVNIVGDPCATEPVMAVFSSLCRRSLRLGDFSLNDVLLLPAGLNPTIILSNPNPALLRRVIAAVNAGKVLRRGSLFDLRSTLVYCTALRSDIDTVLPIWIPSNATIIRPSAQLLRKAADELQPRLLRNRLSSHLSVSQSGFDAPELCSKVRRLARIFGSALEGEPQLQRSLVSALGKLDRHTRAEGADSLEAVLAEALLAASHEGTAETYVSDVATLANGILTARADDRQVSARRAGEVLRSNFKLSTKKRSAGRCIELSPACRRQIHLLAQAHTVWSLETPNPQCSFCAELSTLPDSAHHKNDVHHVHDVHDDLLSPNQTGLGIERNSAGESEII